VITYIDGTPEKFFGRSYRFLPWVINPQGILQCEIKDEIKETHLRYTILSKIALYMCLHFLHENKTLESINHSRDSTAVTQLRYHYYLPSKLF